VPKETLRQETRRVYSEMYQEGIEPFRWPVRFPNLESRAAWRNFVILFLVGAVLVLVPLGFMFARFT
jgi:hypothetical protein